MPHPHAGQQQQAQPSPLAVANQTRQLLTGTAGAKINVGHAPNLRSKRHKYPASMSPPPTQPAPPPGRSTNPFDDDDDSDYDDETISRMLDNMDIDADFNCWTSFRASMSIKSNAKNSIASAAPSSTFDVIGEREEAEEPLTQSERKYIDRWSRRVDREEVYSRTYRPVPREERELKDLAAFLGVTSGGSAAKQSGGAGGLFDGRPIGGLYWFNSSNDVL